MCLLKGYEPDGFGWGKHTPIVKDKLGNISKVND